MNVTKDERNGLFSTLLFLVLFLLVLIFTSLTYQVPPPDEEGVEVNLGYSDEGTGDIQPIEPLIEPQAPSVVEQPKSSREEVATQSTEQTPQVSKTTNVKTISKPTQDITREEQPRLKFNPADYLNKNKSDGGSQGETGKEGDQGNPFGDANAKNYDGTPGEGVAPSFWLLGREAKYLPSPSKNFIEQGTVVVSIWVDRSGKITRAEAGARGTNTTDAALWKLATDAAFKAKFSPNPNAPEVQKGTITYTFIKLK